MRTIDQADISKVDLDDLLETAKQVGGNHYKNKKIQPIQYIFANDLNFAEGSIVKYITRWREKGGVEDLQKIIHYSELLIGDAENEHDHPDGSR